MGDMPWLSVPYSGKIRATAAQLLGVSALPTLLIFDENQQLITANGRPEIIKDPSGERFPWYPKVNTVVQRVLYGSSMAQWLCVSERFLVKVLQKCQKTQSHKDVELRVVTLVCASEETPRSGVREILLRPRDDGQEQCL